MSTTNASYAYAVGNPATYTDPSGQSASNCNWWGGFGFSRFPSGPIVVLAQSFSSRTTPFELRSLAILQAGDDQRGRCQTTRCERSA